MYRAAALALVLLAPLAAQPAPSVTYVLNDGFLLEHAGHAVLIDALFAGRRLTLPRDLVAQITEARGPFANANLLLATHPHPDHFDPGLAAAWLRADPRRRLIAHTQTIDRLRRSPDFPQLRGQVRELTLEPGARERVVLNGAVIDALCLNHTPYLSRGRDIHEGVRHLVFIVNLGGVRFLHLGDAGVQPNLARLNAFPFDKTPVDLLLLRHDDRSLATRQFIARKIKPSRIIAMHLPPADVDRELQAVREAYPYAVVFRQSAEQRALPIPFDYHNLAGDYLGEPDPGSTPQVFARGTVSSDDLEHGAPVFSPGGKEVFWWVNRPPGPENKEWLSFGLAMRRENGRWSAPYTPEFSDQLVLSGDGRRAYFSGRLPKDAPRESQKEDVWVVDRQGAGWSEPKSLNIVGRWPELRFASMISLARNGALYFLAHAPDRELNVGVYRAAFVNGDYTKPELLPDSINMPGTLTWTPFIAPDESYLLFSSNRPGSLDPGRHPAGNPGGDIYISRRLPGGQWTDPVNLGEPVNSKRQERLPGVSPDGKFLFFTRYTPGHNDDVYWVRTAAVPALKR